MKSSNQDIVEGEGKNLKGHTKEAIGKATNDDSLEREGKADQAKGHAQKVVGKVKKVVGK